MDPPVPIPNTAVKHILGDNSEALGFVKIARCRDLFLRETDNYLLSASFFMSVCAADIFSLR